MDYKAFINAIDTCNAKKIKSFYLKGICYTKQLPNNLLPLLKEAIRVLDNSTTFFQEKMEIYFYSIQFTPFSIESELPQTTQRIFQHKSPRIHLTCSLQYIKKNTSNYPTLNDFSHSDSIVIDFTSGEIGDRNYYLSKIKNKKSATGLLGMINKHKLNKAWAEKI